MVPEEPVVRVWNTLVADELYAIDPDVDSVLVPLTIVTAPPVAVTVTPPLVVVISALWFTLRVACRVIPPVVALTGASVSIAILLLDPVAFNRIAPLPDTLAPVATTVRFPP